MPEPRKADYLIAAVSALFISVRWEQTLVERTETTFHHKYTKHMMWRWYNPLFYVFCVLMFLWIFIRRGLSAFEGIKFSKSFFKLKARSFTTTGKIEYAELDFPDIKKSLLLNYHPVNC